METLACLIPETRPNHKPLQLILNIADYLITIQKTFLVDHSRVA